MNFFYGDKIFDSLDLEIYQKSLKKVKNIDKVAFVKEVSKENMKYLEANYEYIVPANLHFYYVYGY